MHSELLLASSKYLFSKEDPNEMPMTEKPSFVEALVFRNSVLWTVDCGLHFSARTNWLPDAALPAGLNYLFCFHFCGIHCLYVPGRTTQVAG